MTVTLGLLCLLPALVTAQYRPPDGAEDLYDLFSPLMLSEGAHAAGGEGPQSDIYNPATSALIQRTTLDVSYFALTGFGSPTAGGGWAGHVANVGVIVPTRAGVFSGSAHFLTSALSGLPWGTAGAIHASAAKELYPGWLIGAGVRVVVGGTDRFDVGASVDLGVVQEAGDVGFMKGLRWGVALQQLGKWYSPLQGFGALPAPFTPVGGISFAVVDTEWFDLGLSASLGFPSFQNVRANIGARIELFDRIGIHGGWKIDLMQLLDAQIATRSLIPSFGISGRFVTNLGDDGFAAARGWTQSEVKTRVSAAPLYNDVWAIGGGFNAPLGIIDTTGPAITVDYDAPEYISPNNDGRQDALVFPITITDERFVVGWRLVVANDEGTLVRVLQNKDDRPENAGFQSVVDRVLAVRSGVPVPETIRWDGLTDAGITAPDGTYTFSLSAMDDNGNHSQTETYTVHVDTVAPSVELVSPASGERIFSPNGDGNKDVFAVTQTGSAEDLWSGEFVDALGLTVLSFEWQNGEPESFDWGGLNASGGLSADGVYRYRIESTDRSGNTGRAELANILINTEETPISLAVSSGYFSPNSDGRLDTMVLTPTLPNTAGIEDWSLIVREKDGEIVRSYTGSQVAPESIEFDGVTDQQTVIREGEYLAEFSVSYRNGNRPETESPTFVVDLTPPQVLTRADRGLFSPNGDGNLDTVTVFQESSRESVWTGVIRDEGDEIVRSFTWTTVADQSAMWNGRRNDGRLSADGRYTYTLEATDSAGNHAISAPLTVVLDTSDAEVAVFGEYEAVSPNADGIRDQQRLFLRVDREDEVSQYRVEVLSNSGEAIRSYEGRSDVADSVVWDGTLASGRRVVDGAYHSNFWVRFTNGVEIEAQSGEFVVDTTPPDIALTTEYTLFSPDGDGRRDTMQISQLTSSEESWSASLRTRDGAIVSEFLWTGTADDVVWDGRDPAGNLVPDGEYFYEISSTDRAGNSSAASIGGLIVDTREPRLFVTATTESFSPNGDGIRDAVDLSLYANVIDGSEGWTLTLEDDSGLVVREFSGDTVESTRTISWDGRDGRGTVREGRFVAVYRINYVKGNRASATSTPMVVDVSPPDLSLGLSPTPFSPDNDGEEDELVISVSVDDVSEIQAWQLEILDRNRRFFNQFSGRGAPAAELIWDGRASDGELVISAEDYPYVFTVADELGNVTVQEGVIPVDILVIRDGDRLKVQISNITFEPNSPQLVIDSADERGAKNLAILLRLAEVFEKYSNYSIRIEGHAVNVTGTDREEREELQPLSLQRAQTVKDAMVNLGIAERRVTVVGLGGTEPIVPHSDLDNRWKNRRVEFVLIK